MVQSLFQQGIQNWDFAQNVLVMKVYNLGVLGFEQNCAADSGGVSMHISENKSVLRVHLASWWSQT